MANTYVAGSKRFTIDTSTNVAGLIALKGSAPAADDDIVVTLAGGASSMTGVPVLTVEQNLVCNSLNLGYAGLNRSGAGGLGDLVVNDGVTITMTGGSLKFCVNTGCRTTFNGTMRSIGVSNGSADQQFNQLTANTMGVQVAGEWWRWVPFLTGERLAVSAASNTTTITFADDPRKYGLVTGQTIEVRTKATGALIGTRVITSTTTTTVGFTGALNVTTAESVYVPIASTDKVYTVAGGKVIFGDGTASAWNNNGGAIPPNGAAVTQCGILLQSASIATQVEMYSNGSAVLAGTEFYAIRNANATNSGMWNSLGGDSLVIVDCCFHHSAYSGLYLVYVDAPVLTRVCAFSNWGNNNIFLSICPNALLTKPFAYYTYGQNIYITSSPNAVVDAPEATNCTSHGLYLYCSPSSVVKNPKLYANGGYGLTVAYGSNDVLVTNPECYANSGLGAAWLYSCKRGVCLNPLINDNGSNGFYIGYSSDCRVYGLRQYANTYNTIPTGCEAGQDMAFAFRTAAAGEVGMVEWWPLRIFNPQDGYGARADSGRLYLVTKDEWVTSPPSHIAGLASYGTATTLVTYNGGMTQQQYRVSHDFGRTWTAWANLPATIADVPDLYGEFIQFRIRKTDATAAIPCVTAIFANVTFAAGWTAPSSWSSVAALARLSADRTVNIAQGEVELCR